MLEYNLIKQHRPRFNVRLRDDKSYPFLAVTVDDEWPRADGDAGPQAQGRRYFGPYAHAYAIRETLDLLLRTFPLRTCSDNKFGRTSAWAGRACCSTSRSARGPASARSTARLRPAAGRPSCSTSSTARPTPWSSARAEMAEAADELEFERAARLRDRLASVRKAIEKQQMVGERSEDLDVIGLAEDELEAAVQVFFVRKGRVVGRKGFVVDKVEDLTGRAGGRMLEGSTTTRRSGIPKQVLVPHDARRPRALRGVAVRAAGQPGRDPGAPARRQASSCRRPSPTTPRRSSPATGCAGQRPQQPGPGAQRAAGAPRPARGAAAHRVLRHEPPPGQRLRRLDGGDSRTACRRSPSTGASRSRRSTATTTSPPWRRCSPAASPPTWRAREAGGGAGRQVRLPAPAAARRRRQGPAGVGGQRAEGARPRRRDPGGLAGQAVRGGLRARPARPGAHPRQSEALYLLQRIRDEAHRFAITYHRQLRGKRMTTSVLDDIPGLGPTRRKRLVKELGGVTAVKRRRSRSCRRCRGCPTRWRSVSAHRRGGGPATPGRARPPAVRHRLVRRGGGLPGVRAHRATWTRPSPRWRGCCEPGGRFLFFLNHPLLQTPNSGWIDDQVLDPPEQYWRIGPYLVEDETIEEVEKGSSSRSSTGRCRAT
jgi:excinuclease ABC subunit C